MGKTNAKRNTSQRQLPVRRTSKDWNPFASNLAHVLSLLDEDQYLILSAKHGNRCLQFSHQGAWGLRAEVVSNHFLKGDDRLTRQQMAWLRANGWNAPTGKPAQATPEHDPDGSPNYYIDFPASAPESDIARLAVDTLIHGLALPYPGALTYESFDGDDGQLAFDELGLKPGIHRERPVMDQVLSVFQKVTGIADLEFDEDGDVSVRYGVILVAAAQLDDRIRLFSALTTDIPESLALLRKLNQMNDGAHPVRFFLREGTVYAVLDVAADPFVPKHLAAALAEFTEVAEGMAIVLNAELSSQAVIAPSGPAPLLQ